MKYLVIPYSDDEKWTIDSNGEEIEGLIDTYIKDGSLREGDKIYECKPLGEVRKTITFEFKQGIL